MRLFVRPMAMRLLHGFKEAPPLLDRVIRSLHPRPTEWDLNNEIEFQNKKKNEFLDPCWTATTYQVYVMLPRPVDVPPKAAGGEVAFFLARRRQVVVQLAPELEPLVDPVQELDRKSVV